MEPTKRYRLSYFDATGELLLDLLKAKSDLPADARLIRITETPPAYTPLAGRSGANMVRFLIESDNFRECKEGEVIPRVEPMALDVISIPSCWTSDPEPLIGYTTTSTPPGNGYISVPNT